ncbi:MAG TPA: Calx-beta domain-containing protein [Chloroflexota bacterium]
MHPLLRSVLAIGLVAAVPAGLARPDFASAQAFTPTVFVSDAEAPEGQPVTFTVTVSGAHPDTTVAWGTIDGTALDGLDFVGSLGNTVTVPATANTATFSVPTVQDATWEPDEQFQVEIYNLTPTGTIIDYRGTGTIRNDDLKPQIAVKGGDVTEGDAGFVNAVFEVTLSNPSVLPVWFDYQTLQGTATGGTPATVGADYVNTTGRQGWTPGTSAPIQILVPVKGDRTHEEDESFQLQLSNIHNADPPSAVATANIINNDPKPAVAVADGATFEGNADHPYSVVASLSNPSIDDVTFKFRTANGTATSPSDFRQAGGGSVTIPAGATSGLIPLTIDTDLQHEDTEAFSVVIYNAQNAFLGDSVSDVTIVDDDP